MSVMNHPTMREAADALLDAGVSLPLVSLRLPFGRRLRLGLTIRRPTLGGQIRVARKAMELGFTYEEMEAFTPEERTAFLATRGAILSEVVALCILRGYVSGRLLTRPLSWLLRWWVRPEYLLAVLTTWVSLLSTQAFMPFIGYVEQANPMQLSQETKGS